MKHMKRKRLASIALSVGALGIVFGDIGTSPLYALQACVALTHISLNREDVYGIISLIIWAVTIVVSLKYVLLIMRADNQGEGGILALIGLLRKKLGTRRSIKWWILAGFAGLSLFYGDSVITPAISVLSAVEGIKVVAPHIDFLIVPVTVMILTALFALQSRGTGKIGAIFGPIMITWFILSGVVGLTWIVRSPDVLIAVSPLTAAQFALHHLVTAFIALGAVVLSVTGAEALYADMGHFGRSAVRRAWFMLVYPALLLNYLGQGALVAHNPKAISSAYFLLYPEWAQGIALVIATLATVIASQAIIAGAFSLTRQAVRLNFAPPMLVKHTSGEEAGQVYIGLVNWIIFVLVVALVLVFRSSINLASAFGMAVSGTLFIDTILFFAVARIVFRWQLYWVVIGTICFGSVDLLFLTSSLSKIVHGGWIPLAIAALAFLVLATWTKGIGIVGRERARREGSIGDFVQKLARQSRSVKRVPGVAVYLSGHSKHAPLAMHEAVERLHELNQHVVAVTVHVVDEPHVQPEKRAVVDELGSLKDGIVHVTLRYGFNDVPNVPRALENLRNKTPELHMSVENANYFISSSDLVIRGNHRMSRLRKYIFVWLYRNSLPPTAYFHLPPERTIDMTSYVEL